MTSIKSSSYKILEVERAASDLRRGEAVLLITRQGERLKVMAGEYNLGSKAKTDATHPAVKLMKIAGLLPRAVVRKANAQGILLTVSEAAIEGYPQALAATVQKVSEAIVPLKDAKNVRVIAFRSRFGHEEHLAVVIGDPQRLKAPYVRVHSSCVTGDVFSSLRCDCGNQLHKALAMIEGQGAGVILYLSQEGRGIGIANKLRAYGLQDKGMDTVEANEELGFSADERDFAIAASILKQLTMKRVTLITNNPAKIHALQENGITVERRVSVVTKANVYSEQYLDTKARKMSHFFNDAEITSP